MSHTTQPIPPTWKPTLIAIGLALCWIGYFYSGTLEAMAQIWWRAETYTHGLIVPLITLWLIWRERHRLSAFQATPTLWPTLPLAAFVFLWLLGELTAVNALTQFSVIGIIVLSIMALVGHKVSKELAFPLGFLFFAVPIGDFLMPRLMEWTADFTVLAVRLSGVPVYREGQSFVIPSGQWSVVEACSGIRYLIASLTIGTLYAYLTYTSLKRRLIFIVVSMLVPIVANWLRAYLIVMLGHLSGNKLAAGVDHLIYGWVFFGIVIAIMFAIGMRWAEHPAAEQGHLKNQVNHEVPPLKIWFTLVPIALIVAIGPILESNLRRIQTDMAKQLSLPASVGAWKNEASVIDWQPNYSNPTTKLHSFYKNGSSSIGLFIAYYRNQNQRNKLITSTNSLLASNDPNWRITNNSLYKAIIAGKPQVIRQAELLEKQGGLDKHYIVWQWYWINGHITSSDIEAKWLTALSILTGHGDDSATVILYSPKNEAAKILPEFTNEISTEINHALAEARAL